jgi:LuxR family transcriptional regulator, maltose regulon positive regulatory protein
VQLLQTKFDPPVELGDLIERPRLQQRLEEAGKAALTVVQTPAGYGKTSLMSQWFHALRKSAGHACWLSLDASDSRDAIGLMTYIAAAVNTAGVAFEPSVERIAAANYFVKPEPLLVAIVNALEQSRTPLFVFIDDVHLLESSTLTVLCRLIDLSPRTVHFVLASRIIPALHLARLRARGKLLELHVDDLRFTSEETQSLFASAGDTSLGQSELAMLEERAEGWIAGIKLARLAVRQGSTSMALLASFAGSQRSVSDFFAEEVLASQPVEVREFLLKTSVLDRLCPALCDAVTGHDRGRQMLNSIEESGLFLLRLDDERNWYRYHHLFSEFLRRRLAEEDSNAEKQLHLRASGWCWANGFYVEAIEYALEGGDPTRAAELLEMRCQDMTYLGQLQTVSKFAARIPEEILHRCPRLMLSIAWQLTRNLRFEETAKLLGVAANLIESLEAESQTPPKELKRLRFLLLHREMMLAAAHDDAPRTEQKCRELIELMSGECHPYLAGTIYAQLLYAQREQFLLGDLDRLTATAQGILARSSFTFASIALQASIGPSLFFAGRSDAALRALEQGLAEAVRFGGHRSSLAALPALPLSEIFYENNELERAEQLIESALPYATELGFVDQLMPGYITHARIRQAKGDLSGAFRALGEGITIAVERGLSRLHLAVTSERVHMLLRDGQSDEAARVAKSAGIPEEMNELLPNRSITTADEMRALTWCRLAVSREQMQDALTLGKQWRRHCTARGAIRSLVRWDLVLAQALFLRGDHRMAQRILREAITIASASRLVRSFIDEGPVIRTMLASNYEGDLEVLHPSDAFAAELLELFDQAGKKILGGVRTAAQAAPEALFGKLSAKEREVLGLVSAGMRNREVAQKLGMTEGSVKWYMQQVYDKIGTRRRFQAVERARQFGLIA